MDVVMPQLGETVREGTISVWHKQVGDEVRTEEPLFEVDNRGDTLFVTLSYPHEIKPSDPLSREVVFVAIKNGRHNGIGYFIDTDQSAAPSAEPIPLTELWSRMVSAF